jgi:hypothetical protein
MLSQLRILKETYYPNTEHLLEHVKNPVCQDDIDNLHSKMNLGCRCSTKIEHLPSMGEALS